MVVGRDAGRAVLIWPLLLGSSGPWRLVRWLACHVGGYGDVLVEDSPQKAARLEAAWSFVKARILGDVISLNGVRSESPLARIIHSGPCITVDSRAAPYIEWENWASWSEYYESLPNSLRSDQRRRLRRLRAAGRVNFSTTGSPGEIESLVHWLIRRKTAWLEAKGLRDYPWKHAPRYADFLCAVAKEASLSNNLFLRCLTVDDTPIAAGLGFHQGGCFRFWKSAYNQDWAIYSPGTMVFVETLKWSFENRDSVFDMMPGPYRYKYNFTSRHTAVRHFLIPCNAKGWLFVKLRCSGLYPRLRSLYWRVGGGSYPEPSDQQ